MNKVFLRVNSNKNEFNKNNNHNNYNINNNPNILYRQQSIKPEFRKFMGRKL